MGGAMTEQNQTAAQVAAEDVDLSSGSYDILRQRLLNLDAELNRRLSGLNSRRRELFGGQDSQLVGDDRVTTAQNCVPRDLVSIGEQLVLGYNVTVRRGADIELEDVFSTHLFDGEALRPAPSQLFDDPRFVKDFKELYRYYKTARFLQFWKRPGRLLLVFQSGASFQDVKVFRFALSDQGGLTYLDDHGDVDYQLPPQQAQVWQTATREHHVTGAHPHVNIDNTLYVECIGGDLTIKAENNTDTSEGILAEPVEDRDQGLDDAVIQFAWVDALLLLRIRPYREEHWRHFIYNKHTGKVRRVDAIAYTCVRLPENQGLVFPRGCYLAEGTLREFDGPAEDMQFLECIRSPNGEDFLYVFYEPQQGWHVMLSYNIIAKHLSAPLNCHGYCLFDNGRMVVFSAPDGEPRQHHPMQFWQTPYCADSFQAPTKAECYLSKIGNRDLVRGIAEGYGLSRLIRHDTITLGVYQELIRASRRMLDAYHWLGHDEAGDLQNVVQDIRATAIAAVGEYEKVLRISADHARQLEASAEAVRSLESELAASAASSGIDDYIRALDRLRIQRGQIVALRNLRYADQDKVSELETRLAELHQQIAAACLDCLGDDDALRVYAEALAELDGRQKNAARGADLKPIQEELDALAVRLDLLTEVVNNLQVDDPVRSAAIINNITDVYAGVNRLRAAQLHRFRELGQEEARVEFAAQFKLLSQSVANFIGMSDTPAKCDEFLTRVMITLEELEGRFSEYDEFLTRLTDKREEIVAAFNARKQQLDDERQAHAQRLQTTALRILKGIQARAESLSEPAAISACFQTDAMAMKFIDCVTRLRQMEESVKADDLEGQFKAAREALLRQQRDRQDIFTPDGSAVTLGEHQFHVNKQPLELTTIVREGELCLHLTGTDFSEPVRDAELAACQDMWTRTLPSEAPDVYRAEFLAYDIFRRAQHGERGLTLDSLRQLAAPSQRTTDAGTLGELVELMRVEAAQRYDEGYERGVHDYDAALILRELIVLHDRCGLLRYASAGRSWAVLCWCFHPDTDRKNAWREHLRSFGERAAMFQQQEIHPVYVADLKKLLAEFSELARLPFPAAALDQAAEYLFYELQDQEELRFTMTAEAVALAEEFRRVLRERNAEKRFEQALSSLSSPGARIALAYDWVTAFLEHRDKAADRHFAWEMTTLASAGPKMLLADGMSAAVSSTVSGLRGVHPLLQEGKLTLQLDTFLLRLEDFRSRQAPRFRDYQRLRGKLLEARRLRLRLSEFKAHTMGGFVRNRLLSEVYLRFIGANFAKQMGAAGPRRRSDQMGLLLLISPPGYGKTTLMEYVAERLGLAFMKVNGPAIGHRVLSLDPAEAPNATAREELHKLNLAFAMGNNVMIYLDDIQHLNPEFLQKFISLCDAQRKIEGVMDGQARTYDLRGKKVAVVMAGNPYTESGGVFKVPDMLANRADTYNLGDISQAHAEVFALSFLENAMTSNSVLAAWNNQGGNLADMANFALAAERGSIEGVSFVEFYAPGELDDVVKTVRHLLRVRDIVLKVNQQYIYSAAQQDEYRTEPPFRLQGSYRNMNRMAEKIFPIMSEQEVDQVILDHYRNEAQTLTTGAESNLLKAKEIMQCLTPAEKLRWDDIKAEFTRRKNLSGLDDANDFGRLLAQLSAFSAGLGQVRSSLDSGFAQAADRLGEVLATRQPKARDEGNVKIDLTPLVAALQNQRIDLAPLAEALQNQRIDLAPLTEALQNQRIDLAPLTEALQNQRVDLASLAQAMQSAKKDNTEAPTELKAIMPPEYAKAWERQILILEALIPLLDAVREQGESFARFQEFLQKRG